MAGNRLVILIVFVSLVALPALAHSASAVTQTQLSDADGDIQAAFVATQHAQEIGGNVSALVGDLNSAIQLVESAEAENATNPALAAGDLSNATLLAQKVATDAVPAGQQGAAARQLQLYLSAGSAVAIVALASLLYVFGDRIYRGVWLRLYGGHVVKKIG